MGGAAAQLADSGPSGLARHETSIEAGIHLSPFGVTAGGSGHAKHPVICQPTIPAKLKLCLNYHVSIS